MKLLKSIPPNSKLILTPFSIQRRGHASYIVLIRRFTCGENSLFEWEDFESFEKFLKEIDHKISCDVKTYYLMAGILTRDTQTPDDNEVITGIPRYAGVLLEDEPPIDMRTLQDVYLKGGSNNDIQYWDIKDAYSQNLIYASARGRGETAKISSKNPIKISYKDIIPNPREEDVYNIFALSTSIPITIE